MGTRYGRRDADGTMEYQDSKESLNAAKSIEDSKDRSLFFGVVGLLIGGVFTYVALIKFGGIEWPKRARH